MRKVAFIPARSGSKRVPHKNIRLLNNKPLLSHTIEQVVQSGIFDDVICATDSEVYADIARNDGATVPFLRTKEDSGDTSPDIQWLSYMLNRLKTEMSADYDVYAILRPTSPFRTFKTIQRAMNLFIENMSSIDSLRAIEECSQHPAKMWIRTSSTISPLLPFTNVFDSISVPWHSCQKSSLPTVWVQNASLEIGHARNIFEKNSISGDRVIGFITTGYEGFDINSELDFAFAEFLLDQGQL